PGVYLLDIRDWPSTNAHPTANPIYIFAEEDGGQQVRISGNFLNFMIYDATAEQRAEWNHFAQYGTWDTLDTTDYEGNFGRDRKVRMRVARMVMKNTVDDVFAEYYADTNPDKEYPRFGLAYFNSEQGSTITQDCQANANETATKGKIDNMLGDSWTPLSESYAELWAYFRRGGSCSITDDQYFLPLDNAGAAQISSNTPLTNWCQLNFIIVVTDGEPTKDDQLRDLSSESLFYIDPTTNLAPWGDIDIEDINDNDAATLPNDGTNYLDDLAHFAYNEDFWPDDIEEVNTDSRFLTHMKNKQFIYTYTVGFSIDNTLLKDTAANGGGEYFTAKDYDTLSEAMKNVFASIDEKVRAFAAFAAPKYSLTYGDRSGYVATFVPKSTQTIWEGHLKSYRLDENGDFPDLENPGDALEWDAGIKLNERSTARTIYTYKGGNLVEFTAANIDPIDLGFNTGDIVADEDYRDAVIDFIRGNNGYNWKLGDTFHFTPLVVGAPLKWKGEYDESYQLFFDHNTEVIIVDGKEKLVSKRTEVVYVGANDGMLHCFRVEDGEELWAFIPPSFLTKLRDIVEGVPGSPGVAIKKHNYFIDGKSIAKDIKVANTMAYTDWKTMIYFGFGFGGNSYCAIDVTDPETPVFKWEFSDPVYSGYSEGKPIIAQLNNDGTGDPFAAIILSGGYDPDEEPATKPNLTGKSFFILNAYSGELVKSFKYGGSVTNVKSLGKYYYTNPSFKYSFAATPAAFDSNSDGFSDTLYMFESGDPDPKATGEGGRIWKVNISGDPIGWLPKNIFQAPDGQTLFLPPTIGYTSGYKQWLFFGTGHRPQPNNPDNLTGQFYGIIDTGLIASTLTQSDFTDVNTLFSASPGDPGAISSGFWFDYVNGTGETIFEPYPIFINSKLYFNTYVPTLAGIKIDPCSPTGNQHIYEFKIITTGSQIGLTDVNVESGKVQGSGLLSSGKFKVYKGSGETGTPDIIDQETIELESVFGSMSWEEKRR
ncbi:MAG: PilC/PilY family type IV pilus protein, partial [Acidobacteriota bacterium]